MSLTFRVQGRLPDSDRWEKLGRFRTMPEARTAAGAFEAKTGGEARIRGHGGEIIKFHTIELTPKGWEALTEAIRAHPEGVNPNVTLEDALRIARDGASPEDIVKMRDDV